MYGVTEAERTKLQYTHSAWWSISATQLANKMNWTAFRCVAGYSRIPKPAQRYRSRSVTVCAKDDKKEPPKQDNPQDNRAASAKPIAGNKGPPVRPAVKAASTSDDSNKQRNQPVRPELANKDRREAGGKSVAVPTGSLRPNPDARKASLDADWGPVEPDRNPVGELVLHVQPCTLALFVMHLPFSQLPLPMLLACRCDPYCSICAWSLCIDHNIVQGNRYAGGQACIPCAAPHIPHHVPQIMSLLLSQGVTGQPTLPNCSFSRTPVQLQSRKKKLCQRSMIVTFCSYFSNTCCKNAAHHKPETWHHRSSKTNKEADKDRSGIAVPGQSGFQDEPQASSKAAAEEQQQKSDAMVPVLFVVICSMLFRTSSP